MDLFGIVWQFMLMWAVIYAMVFVLKHYTNTKKVKRRLSAPQSISLLPTFSAEDTETEEELQDEVAEIEKDQWHIKLFNVRYTTQRCNQFFNSLTKAAPRFWQIWFTLGALAAIFIMVAGVMVITIAAFKILSAFRHALSPTIPHQKVKRSLEEDDQVFLPMIPGVTLPMSHLGYYLIALLVCGVFHEAGHAIASFSERVPIQSAGVFISYLYPGAFVNIPDQQLQMLSPFRQLKIVCAGVWHNLILYLFTMLFLSGGLQATLMLCGWQSLEGLGGVSVVSVRDNSPLALHLPTSAVIYQLDDMPLENNLDDWNSFLLDQHGRNRPSQGFCAATPEQPGTTIDVLASPDAKRCTTDDECGGVRCVTPYTPALEGQMVRIYANMPKWHSAGDERDKVFVFEGELVDIWESDLPEEDDRDVDDEARDIVSDDMPSLLSVPSNRGRRTSVSAESIQPSHTEYVKKVIPKSDQQRERIRTAIGNNFLFRNLDEEQYLDVVNAMSEKRVPANTKVIEQGGIGDFFYIVESGTLDCFVGDQKVTEYSSGGSFGELALMYNAPRAATIVTTSDAVLWALDRVTFRSILMENTARKRRMYEQFLEEVPILKPLDTYERHKIADALESVQYDDQEIVIREGDVGENFYLIESGHALFYKKMPDGSQKEVNKGSKGDYFGELALLNDSPRAATVVAQGRLKCATLGKKAFTRLLGPLMDIKNKT
ncbi:hypothetical protein DFQ28_005282 [Apophysomyces sp. BC1034]|nr:hypothetical protein DFQ29_004160 [Apophysomyces sp. BC1021]KAG0188185.1 hypothetical protein DFQ28_005282 [Apophysomyces sp. BC1034]